MTKLSKKHVKQLLEISLDEGINALYIHAQDSNAYVKLYITYGGKYVLKQLAIIFINGELHELDGTVSYYRAKQLEKNLEPYIKECIL